MLYAKVDADGTPLEVPISESKLRSLFPHVILPAVLTADSLKAISYEMVDLNDEVQKREPMHILRSSIPVRGTDGKLIRVMENVPLSEGYLKSLWATVRIRRDNALRNIVDKINPMRWEALTDAEKDEVKKFRKDLLNITEQNEDPQSIVWPPVPECIKIK